MCRTCFSDQKNGRLHKLVSNSNWLLFLCLSLGLGCRRAASLCLLVLLVVLPLLCIWPLPFSPIGLSCSRGTRLLLLLSAILSLSTLCCCCCLVWRRCCRLARAILTNWLLLLWLPLGCDDLARWCCTLLTLCICCLCCFPGSGSDGCLRYCRQNTSVAPKPQHSLT